MTKLYLEKIKSDIEDLKAASAEKSIEPEPVDYPPGTSPEEKEEEAEAELAARQADKEAKETAEDPEIEEASSVSGGNIAIGLGNNKKNSLIREKEDELVEAIVYNILKKFGGKLNVNR